MTFVCLISVAQRPYDYPQLLNKNYVSSKAKSFNDLTDHGIMEDGSKIDSVYTWYYRISQGDTTFDVSKSYVLFRLRDDAWRYNYSHDYQGKKYDRHVIKAIYTEDGPLEKGTTIINVSEYIDTEDGYEDSKNLYYNFSPEGECVSFRGEYAPNSYGIFDKPERYQTHTKGIYIDNKGNSNFFIDIKYDENGNVVRVISEMGYAIIEYYENGLIKTTEGCRFIGNCITNISLATSKYEYTYSDFTDGGSWRKCEVYDVFRERQVGYIEREFVFKED